MITELLLGSILFVLCVAMNICLFALFILPFREWHTYKLIGKLITIAYCIVISYFWILTNAWILEQVIFRG